MPGLRSRRQESRDGRNSMDEELKRDKGLVASGRKGAVAECLRAEMGRSRSGDGRAVSALRRVQTEEEEKKRPLTPRRRDVLPKKISRHRVSEADDLSGTVLEEEEIAHRPLISRPAIGF